MEYTTFEIIMTIIIFSIIIFGIFILLSIFTDFLIILKNRKFCKRFREELPKDCKYKCYFHCLYCKYSGRWYRERNYK